MTEYVTTIKAKIYKCKTNDSFNEISEKIAEDFEKGVITEDVAKHLNGVIKHCKKVENILKDIKDFKRNNI